MCGRGIGTAKSQYQSNFEYSVNVWWEIENVASRLNFKRLNWISQSSAILGIQKGVQSSHQTYSLWWNILVSSVYYLWDDDKICESVQSFRFVLLHNHNSNISLEKLLPIHHQQTRLYALIYNLSINFTQQDQSQIPDNIVRETDQAWTLNSKDL